MVRKQVYIEERQEALLKRLSKTMGMPQSEIIREGIDRAIQAGPAFRPDPQAVAKFRRDLKSLLRDQRYRFRPWTRDMIHER